MTASNLSDKELLSALIDRYGFSPTPSRVARASSQFVDVLIPIGRDHVATLTIEKDSLPLIKGE